MLTVWVQDFPRRIKITDATPDEWITDELLEEIKQAQRMQGGYPASEKLVSWDEANQAVTFHTADGNVVYRLTGEYNHHQNSWRIVWPD